MSAALLQMWVNAVAVRLCEAPGRPARQEWIIYSVCRAILLLVVDREFITSIIFLCKTRVEGNDDRCVHTIT
jgi:hypothetical protein